MIEMCSKFIQLNNFTTFHQNSELECTDKAVKIAKYFHHNSKCIHFTKNTKCQHRNIYLWQNVFEHIFSQIQMESIYWGLFPITWIKYTWTMRKCRMPAQFCEMIWLKCFCVCGLTTVIVMTIYSHCKRFVITFYWMHGVSCAAAW